MLPAPLEEFIRRMPKVETHLHLEGAIQPATLLAIAQRNNVELPARDVAGIAQLFRFRHFHEFLTVFMAMARALRYGEDFEQIAYELGCHLAEQHVRYAEVMISPSQHLNRGVDLDEAVQGASSGFARAQAERGIRAVLAFDYGRQFGTSDAWRVLEVAMRNQRYGLVGWSIGGDEVNYPPEIYREVFAAARNAGLHLMAHAGEVAGPESVWGAIDALAVERVGHGIRSVGDPLLLQQLCARRITLDVCPTSNVLTGAVSRLETHPLRTLYDAGVPLTLNTDDPTFFSTTLTNEYRVAAEMFGFGADELSEGVLAGARASFQPEAERQALAGVLASELRQLRSELGV